MSPREVLFATTNAGKLRELEQLAEGLLGVRSLADFPGAPEVEEDRDTLAGNAEKKARFHAGWSGLPTLADDSGLCVDALGGRPGVHSARYALGPDSARIAKLLRELISVPDGRRGAQFRCVLCLAHPDGRVLFTEGSCAGEILRTRAGEGGFGYDPVLYVPVLGKSMGELTREEKANISHRGQAFRAMRPHLLRVAAGAWG